MTKFELNLLKEFSKENTNYFMHIYQMMLHTLVFKRKLKKKILMLMIFNSSQQKKLLKMEL